MYQFVKYVLSSNQGDMVVDNCNGCTTPLLGKCAPLVLISGVDKNRRYACPTFIFACPDVHFAVVYGGCIGNCSHWHVG